MLVAVCCRLFSSVDKLLIMGRKSNKLTDKQSRFCEEYLVDLNLTQAAIRAGYSEKTAGQVGYDNLQKPLVAERIAELKRIRSDKVEIDQNAVLENLVKAMKISLGEEDSYVVGNVEGSTSSISLKKTDLAAYLKIQDMLAKHLGLYEKDNEQISSTVIQSVVLSDEMAEKLNKDLEDEC